MKHISVHKTYTVREIYSSLWMVTYKLSQQRDGVKWSLNFFLLKVRNTLNGVLYFKESIVPYYYLKWRATCKIFKTVHLSTYDMSFRHLVYTKLSEEHYFFISERDVFPFPLFVTLQTSVSLVKNVFSGPYNKQFLTFHFTKAAALKRAIFLIAPFPPFLFDQAGRIKILQKLFRWPLLRTST